MFSAFDALPPPPISLLAQKKLKMKLPKNADKKTFKTAKRAAIAAIETAEPGTIDFSVSVDTLRAALSLLELNQEQRPHTGASQFRAYEPLFSLIKETLQPCYRQSTATLVREVSEVCLSRNT